jgi:Predicted pyridoxal phosphate-dependent enzyme apparently involved in regulation of cell wall biogenesis
MYRWPYVDGELEKVVREQLLDSLSDKGSDGVIKEVEKKIAAFYDVPYALLFSSATGAMHSLKFALDLRPGDEILVPTYTFFATFSPFAYEGIGIVQCDSDLHGQISVFELEKRVTSRTRAVVCTHMWGVPCDLDSIRKFCDRHDIYLIEDGSHAHLGRYRGDRLGRIADAAVFSTNQKVLTSGEGGFLITRDRNLYERSILFGHYNERSKNEISDPDLRRYALTGLGLKYRATTLSAAILSHQLDRAGDIEKRRGRNYRRFVDAVAENPLLANIEPGYPFDPGLYVFPFLARDNATRERLLAWSASCGNPYFDAPGSTRPLFDQPLFQDSAASLGMNHGSSSAAVAHASPTSAGYPNAIDFFSRVAKLPLWGYPGDDEDVELCTKALATFA